MEVTIDLYKELDHTGDLAYEITSQNIEEFLKDVVNILIKNSETSFYENSKDINFDEIIEKCYNIVENVEGEKLSDSIFDMVNDIISFIDRGFYPLKFQGNCVYFHKSMINLKIKALTYHKFVVEKHGECINARMVFDI